MPDSCESCSSDEDIGYQILPATPTYSEVMMLLQQNHFLTDDARFVSCFTGCHVVRSDDLILAFYAMADYSSAHECIEEGIDSAIRDLTSKSCVSGAVCLFFSSRISNVPLDMVHELYKTVQATAPYYLVISQLEKQDRGEQRRACATFPEFDPSDLRMWPKKEEEIFLLRCPARTDVDSRGKKYRVFLLTQPELNRFINDFAAELGQN